MELRNTVTMIMAGVLLLWTFVSLAEDDRVEIKSEQWDMPRHGETVIQVPGMAKFLNQWAAKTDNIIEIRYPGGEEGELWMQELKGWLIALGIPGKAIVHTPGSGSDDLITLELIRRNTQHE